jgi:magnesium transporter
MSDTKPTAPGGKTDPGPGPGPGPATEAAARLGALQPADAAAALSRLPRDYAAAVVSRLGPARAASVLREMHPVAAAPVLLGMARQAAAAVLAEFRPDDRVDLLAHAREGEREELLRGLGPEDVAEVRTLESYPPETAGGIMTTEVTALPERFTVDRAIAELRRRRQQQEQMFYVYTTDGNGRLVGVVSMRDLILSGPATSLADIAAEALAVRADADQEEAARLLRRHGYLALPVVDAGRRLLGLITADDVADVLQEEATEDIQKLGGSEALDAPYLSVGFRAMLRKRGAWLTVLFAGEMLTATAMGYFEHQIERAVLLALFVPLIISSGGNSGSQAATIVVRSLALGELTARDGWRVLLREARTGLALGAWLGLIGFLRIAAWQRAGWFDYGPHYLLVGLVVGASLVGVITFGSVAGSLLPLALHRVGLDPAASSAPFVATIVDVTGIVIYFGTATLLLRGTLL